jgi:hypothetical protein
MAMFEHIDIPLVEIADDEVIEYVAENFTIDEVFHRKIYGEFAIEYASGCDVMDVFNKDVLEEWARTNGFIEEGE